MRKRILSRIAPIVGIVIFFAALWVLQHELKSYRYQDIVSAVKQVSTRHILLAIVVTIINFVALTGYDFLAFRYIKHPLPYRKIALASFIGYAMSNSVGFAMLTGSTVRYRLYSDWGLAAIEIAKVVTFCVITLWIGLFTLGGLGFSIRPMPLPSWMPLPFASTRPIGIILLLSVISYLLVSLLKKRPLSFRGWEVQFPSFGISFAQIVVSSLDWALAGTILYVLLPPTEDLSFLPYLSIYLLAQIAGLASHLPGGIGVFESVILLGLSGILPTDKILGAILAFRVIYYLFPLIIAVILLGIHEILERRRKLLRIARAIGDWVPDLAPRVFSFMTFVAGAILLFSGATPAVGWRLVLLRGFLPMPVIEASHFLGSLVGVALLMIARGLQLRLDAAFLLTIALLGVGVIASLLKGMDYEEASILAVTLTMLIPCRRYFYRKASLLSEWFTQGWIISILLVMVGSVWLFFFSFKHIEYSEQLWWEFAFNASAPRALRATVGAVILCSLFAMARLLRPAFPRRDPDSPVDMEKVLSILRTSIDTTANLALLGDKLFLFSESGQSLIMYGIEGRSWVSMGDPVGLKAEVPEIVWQFKALCDLYGGLTVFYEVGRENLPLYLDLGLTLLKIGEEARVKLKEFSLDGKSRKGFRNTRNRFEREGFKLDVISPEDAVGLLPDLRLISDAWLSEKNTREKGFSLGRFDPEYLKYFPFAVIRNEHRIAAFANLWISAEKEELSVDLMRYSPDAPPETMDYLFIELLFWGKAEGYRWFNLGMAPLSGFESSPVAPGWNKLGSFVYSHGESFYNFQGLRKYKEKFDPYWEPKYIASPGGMVLPVILANVASLISGGIKGVVSK